MDPVNTRTFSRVTIKRTYTQVMMGIKEKTFDVLLKKAIFLRNRKLSLISQTMTFEQ